MKQVFTALLLLVSFNIFGQYQITLNIPQYTSGTAYLTYHWGKNLNIADSAQVSQGKVVFKGTQTLPGGIYSVVLPGKRYMQDFLVDKPQKITITIKDTLRIMDMEVVGSPENDLFNKYQKYTSEKGAILQRSRRDYSAAKNKQDSLKYEKEFLTHNAELIQYRKDIISTHPESMMAMLLSAMQDPEVLNRNPITREDSVANYNHYKQHYWDGISFMDERVLRTPFFIPKFERYYREVIHPAPDSIIADIDYKLLLTRSAPELNRYMLNWLTDEYINPKYMGQDAIFVHLFNKYHSKGLTPWLNEKQMETITRRAYMQMSNLIGEKAADLKLLDSTGKVRSLYDLKADYTVVVFWDPNCGHCKQEVPRIDSMLQAKWKAKNVKIYGVLSENDSKADWVNFTKKHNLTDWTHVHSTDKMEEQERQQNVAGFRQLYDVIQSPTLYLLDKDKRIIGKKLSFEQINSLLDVKWEKDNQ